MDFFLHLLFPHSLRVLAAWRATHIVFYLWWSVPISLDNIGGRQVWMPTDRTFEEMQQHQKQEQNHRFQSNACCVVHGAFVWTPFFLSTESRWKTNSNKKQNLCTMFAMNFRKYFIIKTFLLVNSMYRDVYEKEENVPCSCSSINREKKLFLSIFF